MTHATEHCARPWWKRPPVWFVAIAVVLAVIAVVVFEETGKHAPMPYGNFLDQLEAGNVASVTIKGTEITGRFKQPLDNARSGDAARTDAFRSRMPDFGDMNLIPALRKQHVPIDIASSTSWTRLLAGIPLPMLLFLGAILVAGLVRLARGGKAQPGSAMPMGPMQGMIGIISGLFGKQQKSANEPTQTGDQPKTP